MDLIDYLKIMTEKDGSDLYLSTGARPIVKVHGDFITIDEREFVRGDIKHIACAIMDAEKQKAFERDWEMNLSLSVTDIGRYRVNIFIQRNEVSMVVRRIKQAIPDPENLGLPDILKTLIMKKNGLILFVGATGTGKSTSLASLIRYRSEKAKGHILTVEDPIEFLHQHAESIVNQREIGVDTSSYQHALENAMRQAPDVILVGEIRERTTMEYAMTFAETGHLCLSTLHAHNASQAIDRIINFFPQDHHQRLLLDLSLNLVAIISQRLVVTHDQQRIAAFEVLLATPLVTELIKRGQIDSIRETMNKSEIVGMQTFDTALFHLYKQNHITAEEALRNADSPNNLRLRINLATGISDQSLEKYSLQKEEDKPDVLRSSPFTPPKKSN